MSRPAARRHWPLLVFAITMVILVVLYISVSDPEWRRVFNVLLAMVPTSWAVSEYSRRNIERYRLFIDRIWANLRNASITWGCDAEYPLEEASDVWPLVEKTVQASVKASDVLNVAYGEIAVVTKGMPVRVSLKTWTDPVEGEKVHLLASFLPVTASLRAWRSRLEDVVEPFLRQIEESVHHVMAEDEERRFAVKVVFETENPYFGYFLARIDRKAIAKIDVQYFEHVADERALVKVEAKRLEFVAFSLDTMRRLSLKYLALSEPDG